MRSWSETVFRTALIGREGNEIDEIVNIFYSNYEKEIAEIQMAIQWIIFILLWKLKKYKLSFYFNKTFLLRLTLADS